MAKETLTLPYYRDIAKPWHIALKCKYDWLLIYYIVKVAGKSFAEINEGRIF